MDINLQKLEKWVAIVVCTLIVAFVGYLYYVVFFTGPKAEENPTLSGVSSGVFNANVQKAIASLNDPAQKINLKKKDLLFTESALYKSFSEKPYDVPLSDSRGRPDPFVPYAAP